MRKTPHTLNGITRLDYQVSKFLNEIWNAWDETLIMNADNNVLIQP